MEVVYDEVKAVTNSVLDERNALNTRASFILGSASTLVGVVTGILDWRGIGQDPKSGKKGDIISFLKATLR